MAINRAHRLWSTLAVWFTACAASQAGHPAASPEATAYYAADGGRHTRAAEGEVAELLRRVRAADARAPALQPDARLDALAMEVAERAGSFTTRQLEFQARLLGLYDPRFDVLEKPLSDASALRALAAELVRRQAAESYTHYGAVVRERGAQRWVTLVLSSRRVRLDSLPRTVALGAAVRLRGSLPEGLGNVRVELLDAVSRVVVPVGAARELSVQVPTATRGLHRVSLIAEGARGDEVLAKLPIYVGEAFPVEPPPHAPSYDCVAVADSVLTSINRARARAGLAPLRRDARLDHLAAAHNTDMRAHEFVGHVSPSAGNETARVARAGLPTALVLETIARATAPGSLEARSDAPAGDQRNWLSPSVTRVGIDVTQQSDALGSWLVATELFVDMPERIEPASAKPQLLSWVNEARVQRGAKAIGLDAGLCALAGQAAERFLREASATEQSILTETDRELSHFSLAYRRVHSLLVVARRLQDAATLEAGLDPHARGLGIGIAQGERGGRSVLAVVMLVGTER